VKSDLSQQPKIFLRNLLAKKMISRRRKKTGRRGKRKLKRRLRRSLRKRLNSRKR